MRKSQFHVGVGGGRRSAPPNTLRHTSRLCCVSGAFVMTSHTRNVMLPPVAIAIWSLFQLFGTPRFIAVLGNTFSTKTAENDTFAGGEEEEYVMYPRKLDGTQTVTSDVPPTISRLNGLLSAYLHCCRTVSISDQWEGKSCTYNFNAYRPSFTADGHAGAMVLRLMFRPMRWHCKAQVDGRRLREAFEVPFLCSPIGHFVRACKRFLKRLDCTG